MIGEQFCLVPQAALAAANTRCRWPRGQVVRWTIDRILPPFDGTEFREICALAWSAWQAECGVRLEWVESRPNIVVGHQRIDGPGQVLAQAELPCGVSSDSVIRTWFDSRETWVEAENPSGRMVDLLRVAIHEFGHCLGIGHIEHQPAIMNPRVSQIRSLREPDIAEARDRYGDPSTTPPPDGELCCSPELLACFPPEGRDHVRRGFQLIRRGLRGGK